MTLYTFYPCKADGTSDTFVCLDLHDDGEAQVRGRQILDEHPASARVVVWAGDRKVSSLSRSHADAREEAEERASL